MRSNEEDSSNVMYYGHRVTSTARFVNLPRITFKFRLEYSESFQMTRMHWHVTSEPTIFYSYYTVYYYGVDRCGHHLSVHGNVAFILVISNIVYVEVLLH